MRDKSGYLFIIMGAMLWGTTGTAQSFAPDGAHPFVIGAVRLAFGGIVLVLIAFLQRKVTVHNWPVKETLLATLGMACYQPLFFIGCRLTEMPLVPSLH